MILKELKLRSLELKISVGDNFAEKVRSNFLYRHLVRPFRKRAKNDRNDAQRTAYQGLNYVRQQHNLLYEKSEGSRAQTISPETAPEQKKILEKIRGVEWYHSINLGNGVVTPGSFEHEPYLNRYHIPDDLTGKRVLDVATFDGFWAFEFERRGAAEVIGLDIESHGDLDLLPRLRARIPRETLEMKTGMGFNMAREILGSKADRRILNLYDLSPERLGRFDMVFSGDILTHLMNPMKALQNICSVTSGFAIIVEPFNPELNSQPSLMHYMGGWHQCMFWLFSLGSLKNMITGAGFSHIELLDTFEFGVRGKEEKMWRAVYKAVP